MVYLPLCGRMWHKVSLMWGISGHKPTKWQVQKLPPPTHAGVSGLEISFLDNGAGATLDEGWLLELHLPDRRQRSETRTYIRANQKCCILKNAFFFSFIQYCQKSVWFTRRSWLWLLQFFLYFKPCILSSFLLCTL